MYGYTPYSEVCVGIGWNHVRTGNLKDPCCTKDLDEITTSESRQEEEEEEKKKE